MIWMTCTNCATPMIGIVSYENFTQRTTCWSCQKEQDPSLEDGEFSQEEYDPPQHYTDDQMIDPAFDGAM